MTFDLDQMRPQTERIAGFAQRFCQAVANGGTDRLVTPQDLLVALPLAIARHISITMPSADRSRQVATAEALLRQLGRGVLSASYDRMTIAALFDGDAFADG